MARHDIAFVREGFGPRVTVNPEDSDTYSMVEAFVAFMRQFGEDFTLSMQGGRYVLEPCCVDEAEDTAFDYEGEFNAAFGVLAEAGLMQNAPEDLGSLEELGFTQAEIEYAFEAVGYPKAPEPETFAVGDLVELTCRAGGHEAGDRFVVHDFDEDGDILDDEGSYFYPEELRKVTEEPKAPEVARDIRTGLAIPAPGFPWSEKPKKPENPFKVGDRLRSKKHGTYSGTVKALGSPWEEGREHDAVTYTSGEYDFVVDMELEEPKKPTAFQQGDIVKVVRVTHEDDRKYLDSVGPVLGTDMTHFNGQTVHVSFWNHATGDDEPWWVHHDSLDLVFRPGVAS